MRRERGDCEGEVFFVDDPENSLKYELLAAVKRCLERESLSCDFGELIENPQANFLLQYYEKKLHLFCRPGPHMRSG